MRYRLLLVLVVWVISFNVWADTKSKKIFDYISRTQQAVDAGFNLKRETKDESAFKVMTICVDSLMNASKNAMAYHELRKMHSLVTEPNNVAKGREILLSATKTWKYEGTTGRFCKSIAEKGQYSQLTHWLTLAAEILAEDPSQFE